MKKSAKRECIISAVLNATQNGEISVLLKKLEYDGFIVKIEIGMFTLDKYKVIWEHESVKGNKDQYFTLYEGVGQWKFVWGRAEQATALCIKKKNKGT